MLDVRTQRLSRKLDQDVAEKLVAAGFDTPRKIKAATDRALRAIDGIGQAAVTAIREQFPSM